MLLKWEPTQSDIAIWQQRRSALSHWHHKMLGAQAGTKWRLHHSTNSSDAAGLPLGWERVNDQKGLLWHWKLWSWRQDSYLLLVLGHRLVWPLGILLLQHGDGTDLPTWRYNWIFLIQQYKHVYLINPKKKEIIWLLFQVGLMISLVQLSKGRPSQVQNLPVALSMTWSSSESESGFLTLPQADPDSGKKHSAWGHKLKLTLTPHRHPIIPWMQQSFIFALDNTHVKQYNTTIRDITANKYSRLFIK